MAPRYWYGLDKWISPLGLGCWQLGGEHELLGKPNGWGPVDEAEAIALIAAALDNGIRLFDTAIGYGDGRSETLLGLALERSRVGGEATICTKAPLSPGQEAIDDRFLDHVRASADRLRRERIDILLIHNPPGGIDWSRFDRSPLERLQAEGRIGTFGVSTRTLNDAVHVMGARFGTCVEWVYGPLERRPARDLFPGLQEARMNFIARSPLSRGYFSEALYRRPASFPTNDFRSTLPAEWIDWVRGSIDALGLAEQDIDRLSHLALLYCLRSPEVTAIIPGMKRIEHLQDYVRMADGPGLPPGFHALLEERTAPCFPGWT